MIQVEGGNLPQWIPRSFPNPSAIWGDEQHEDREEADDHESDEADDHDADEADETDDDEPGSNGGDEQHEDGGEADDHVAKPSCHLLALSLLGGFSSLL